MGNHKGLPCEMKTNFTRNSAIEKPKFVCNFIQNKGQILFLSTYEQPGVSAEGKSLVNVCYNKYMIGINKFDQY